MSDTKPIIGSVELTNARLYYKKPGNRPMIKVEELPYWVQIPQRVIDPLDLKKLKRIARETPAKDRPGITIRVLRVWYEMTTQALLASEVEGTPVRVPEVVRPSVRERPMKTGKVGRDPGGFSGLPRGYMSS